MKKKILIIIGIIIIVGSILLNGYFIGWKRIERRIYAFATNDVVNAILFQLENTGQVVITTQEGQIILVPRLSGATEEAEFE